MQARLPAALDAAAAHDLLLANTPAGSALLSDPETREQHAKIKVWGHAKLRSFIKPKGNRIW